METDKVAKVKMINQNDLYLPQECLPLDMGFCDEGTSCVQVGGTGSYECRPNSPPEFPSISTLDGNLARISEEEESRCIRFLQQLIKKYGFPESDDPTGESETSTAGPDPETVTSGGETQPPGEEDTTP